MDVVVVLLALVVDVVVMVVGTVVLLAAKLTKSLFYSSYSMYFNNIHIL